MGKRAKWALTGVAVILLIILGVRYTLEQSEMKYDILVSIAGIFVFLWLWKRTNQDALSYAAFLFMLIMHNLYLYPLSPLGINWDHYMHTISGFAAALIADRWFLKERWGRAQRGFVIFFLVMGAGALHEVVEWLGYAFLGEGDGFLFFGAGDEGEWRNAMIDLMFNGLGAFILISWLYALRAYRAATQRT